ncbi:hypothetical protein XENORESO_009095 [Xenotaenia resolanae]|uniref:Uncharacterized protein n=1 Tax=Xenotaenia resolanae TaxID=208358 RepID=A0ABV0X064_9TELE
MFCKLYFTFTRPCGCLSLSIEPLIICPSSTSSVCVKLLLPVLLISNHHGGECEETYPRSKTSVFMPGFTRLSRSCPVSKGRSRQQTFIGSNNNRVQPFCQQLQQTMFSQCSF